MADLSSILKNISLSLDPLYRLVTGASYLLGLMLFWTALKKLKVIADSRANSGSHGQMFIPLVYIFGGATFFYLPTMVGVMSNTFFGAESPIAYANWWDQQVGKYGQGVIAVSEMIRFAGLLWFIRGTMLLVQASEPGVQHGPKGLAFTVGGILAMNFQYTSEQLANLMHYIATTIF